jgi:hypothetical protein
MNLFMGNPPDAKSLFPESFTPVGLVVSPEKNNEF